jgi:hypothetical protein
MKCIALILLLVCGFCVSSEAKEIYEWLDKDGLKHLTDKAPPPDATILNETKEITSPDVVDTNDRRTESEAPKKEIQKQDTAKSQAAPAVSSGYVDTDENYIEDPGVRRREEERRQHKGKETHSDDLEKTGDEPKRSRSEGHRK